MKAERNKGVTLLELLVAIAIFGMLFGGLFTMLRQENKLISHSQALLNARLLANEVIETLKAAPFEQLQSYAFERSAQSQKMNVNVFVTDFGSNTLKKIYVIVRWSDPLGNQKSFTLATLRSKNNSEQRRNEGG